MKKNYYKLWIILLFSIILLPLFSSFSTANTGENPSIRFIRIAAENGNAEAQYHLAVAYDSGDGINKDPQQALFWYQKAADQEHVDAMFNLAVSYDKGEGTETNKELALFWYNKAAKAGDTDAQNNLAVMYREGEGTAVNYPKALEWFLQAAMNNNPLAQYNLGEFYYFGRGTIPSDKVQSYAWFTIAAENHVHSAAFHAIAVFNELNEKERFYALTLANDYIQKYKIQCN